MRAFRILAAVSLAASLSMVPVSASASASVSAPAGHAGQRAVVAPAVTKYSNCAKLNRVYPHGVGRKGAHDRVTSGHPVTNFTVNTTVYNANKARDRDKDGVACEKH